jgi:hypothetical protein
MVAAAVEAQGGGAGHDVDLGLVAEAGLFEGRGQGVG